MCLQPITIRRKAGNKFIENLVPCGVCPECLKKRQSAIVVRTIEVAKRYHSLCFITLTYNDDRLPVNEFGEPTLRREDLKNWKKEFRKKISTTDFAWLLSGEYGPRTKRPHYHGLIAGLSESDLNIAKSCWSDKYGFAVFKSVPVVSLTGYDDVGSVAKYVAKYVIKDSEFKSFSDTVEQPRLMTSIGYGIPYDYDRFRNHILAFDKFRYNPFDASTISPAIVTEVASRLKYDYRGFHYSIPLYILKKLLYEKNFKGNLQASPLQSLVTAYLRNKSFEQDAGELQSVVSGVKDGETFEALREHYDSAEFHRSIEFDSSRKDLLKTYKKSVL